MMRVQAIFTTALLALFGCGQSEAPVNGRHLALSTEAAVFAQDLAILIPMDVPNPITAGDGLLPEAWLDEVDAVMRGTPVGDAMSLENYPDDFRIVSLRVNPCAPLGIHPGQAPGQLCWPEVRLVWQPVIRDMDVGWARFDYYADDRAIHAIYPYVSDVAEASIRADVEHALSAGEAAGELPASLVSRFSAARDAAVMRLITEVTALRGDVADNALQTLDVRAELFFADGEARGFMGRLRSWLERRTPPSRLGQLTAFSLPEGRVPALADIWVFVAFAAENGQLRLRDIPITSRRDGRTLVTLPGVQVVDMSAEDPIVTDALGNSDVEGELREQVIFDSGDIARLGHALSDPAQTLIPNTSCASCHRLNDIRFDFHNLSHLEERPHTVSPRVRADVEHELAWLRGFFAR